ncbi:hypothetical protein [Elizabethkingia sp. M8]|uniref:hypothetical protein n=1 Tax=Elizabethkingia sp. M8 TaxID=2796140 RepID=UPI001902DD63|nr:hypothetical protein [Elizabethkingia sp. M8]QQM25256.1 hypothetical protein JCR23_10085 [Elizabethkingia sp. M8]QQM25936.1 hypothetical protein JCR23_13780 [Elizabethkingia sp. M8]
MVIKREVSVREFVSDNLKIFHVLAKNGIKNINTASEYLMIYDEYNRYQWIEDKNERLKVVADKCQCHFNTVNNAIKLMERVLVFK